MSTSAVVWIMETPSLGPYFAKRLLHIDNVENIFDTIGLDILRAQNWFSKNGIRSVDKDGVSIVPDFPNLSKLFWVSVEDEILSGFDLKNLSQECEFAMKKSSLQSTRTIFAEIRALSNCALSEGLQLVFSKA